MFTYSLEKNKDFIIINLYIEIIIKTQSGAPPYVFVMAHYTIYFNM
jgi:hypothetical protein